MASSSNSAPSLGLQTLSLSSSFEKYRYLTTTGNHPSIDPDSASRAILNDYALVPKPRAKQFLMENEQQAKLEVLRDIVRGSNRQESGLDFVDTDLMLSEEVEEAGPPGYQRRVDSLYGVPEILSQLWLSDSDKLSQAAEALADGARDYDWREPYGESGVLDFFLTLIKSQGTTSSSILQSLRLLGNSCADVDRNRERIVASNSTLAIMRQLQNPSLVHVAIPVLYNVCVDYEPAQRQATSNGLAHQLIDLISSQTLTEDDQRNLTGYICRLLELSLALPSGIDASPENAPEVLLQLASDPRTKFEDFLDISGLVVTYLTDIRFQQRLVAHRTVELVLSILLNSYGRPLSSEDALKGSGLYASAIQDPESESEKSLSKIRNALIQVLSDISALPEFKVAYPLDNPLVGSLHYWLSASQRQLRICSCIMLGNLARSDDVCWTMVHEFGMHHPLIKILEESESTDVVHAAASFLKNLALMPGNKDVLGECGLVELTSRYSTVDAVPQLQYSGASLLRHVISGSFANIKRLLAPLSDDPDSPAHLRTYLSILLALCDRTDQAAIKMEVARSVTAVSRALNSSTGPASQEERDELLDRFYDLHPNVAWPLGMMVNQTTWPVVKSEGWFAFALMAKTAKGCEAINSLLTDPEVLKPLVELITGQKFREWEHPRSASRELEEDELENASFGAQSEDAKRREQEMRKFDRENALVLISKILENALIRLHIQKAERISPFRKQLFEDLLVGSNVDYLSLEQIKAAATEANHSDYMRPRPTIESEQSEQIYED
ncbi:MAG: hypothetical protein M4579_005597 [Chaenotheca gracillima]|nr:MAG: hypothetical protein M4579_005597 [Chaenotheca gracillima]